MHTCDSLTGSGQYANWSSALNRIACNDRLESMLTAHYINRRTNKHACPLRAYTCRHRVSLIFSAQLYLKFLKVFSMKTFHSNVSWKCILRLYMLMRIGDASSSRAVLLAICMSWLDCTTSINFLYHTLCLMCILTGIVELFKFLDK